MGSHDRSVPLDLFLQYVPGLLQLNLGRWTLLSRLGVAEPLTSISVVHLNVPHVLWVVEQLIEGDGIDLLDGVDGVLGIVGEEQKRLGMVFEVIIATVLSVISHGSTKGIHHNGVGGATCSDQIVHWDHLSVHVGDCGLLLGGGTGALPGLGLQSYGTLDPEVEDGNLLFAPFRAHAPHDLQLIEAVVLSELLAGVLELVIGRQLDHLLRLLLGLRLLGDCRGPCLHPIG